METFGLAVLAFFVILGPLILVHEIGHFLAARLVGVQIEEFGIGYPPRLLTLFEHGGTQYTLNAIPLGGFVRPKGEDDPLVEGGLGAASKRSRLLVLSAGAAANILAGYILLVVTFMLGAPEAVGGARILAVAPDGPAESAGLQVGDIILDADDIYIERSNVLTDHIYGHTGVPITLTVLRGEETLTITLTPRESWPPDQGPTGIQIEGVTEIRRHAFFPALGQAAREIGELGVAFARLPGEIIRRQIDARWLRPLSVVGMSQLGGQAIDQSIDRNAAWPILSLTASISLALAFTNLLPIPAMDGGRILFVLIEALRGRRVDPTREMVVHLVGFVLLLTAGLVLIYLDIVNPLF